MTKKYLFENTIVGMEQHDKWVTIEWSDGKKFDLSYIWLKDSHISKFHESTQERLLVTHEIDLDLQPTKVELVNEDLVVTFPDEDEPLVYSSLWLEHYGRGSRRTEYKRTYWAGESEYTRPSIDYKDFCNDSEKLHEFMLGAIEYGLAIIENAPIDENVLMESVGVIGHIRETNYGRDFKVISKPNPENLAYTSLPLQLHTDLTYLAPTPNFQFLHCCANDAQGGLSTYIDVWRVANDFKKDEPKYFEILSTIEVPKRYSDDIRYMVRYAPIIGVDKDGNITEVAHSNHLTYINDLPAKEGLEWYEAYIAWGKYLNQEKYLLAFAMKPGEIAVFDNRRVMHGRTEFFPNTGSRHLQGTYICQDEYYSRLTVADRTNKGINWKDYM